MPNENLPCIEAHRGDREHAPENTMAAFQMAVELEAPWIELDIHPSKDGTLVVIHDDTVDRTTNGAGTVTSMTLDELQGLDAGSWFSDEFAGQRIPTLEEVMELLKPTQTLLNIEIKESPDEHELPQMLVGMLRRYGRELDYLVASFDLSALLAVRAIAPEVPLALIGGNAHILPLAEEHGFQWIHAHADVADEQFIARAHASGVQVNVWPVDDPEQIPHWRALGVDKICTNRPTPMLAF